MEKMKVFAKIEERTHWVNPIVIVEKPNGKLRICLDPCDLKKDVERFLGMVTYLAKLIPNMSQHTEPLRGLTRDDVAWEWKEEQCIGMHSIN